LRQRKEGGRGARDTVITMTRKAPRIPLNPKFPERVCWGCEQYCPAEDLACGNGTIRTLHPVELFGEDWLDWSAGKSPADQKPSH
jgi:hypothetical protein